MKIDNAAEQYVRRIRNKVKRQYAAAYMGYLYRTLDHCPEHPKNLPVMAGQAVRLNLHALIKANEEARSSVTDSLAT